MFIDRARIHLQAGAGGNGVIAFRREKYVPRGGPSGGDGGKGGDIYLQADPGLSTLVDFRYRHTYRAGRGQHGQGKNKHGAGGEDVVIRVPVGTVVRDAGSGELVADLVEGGQRVLVAKGGRGGRGNARFMTPTDRAPRRAEEGWPGEERWLALELKLLADVGLIGLPNAGKSTLLSRLSAARPKIADYPFTTLEPVLGVVWVDYGVSFVMADIPGLIAGAHQGAGLGHEFLRHVERTRVLAHVVDVSPGQDVLASMETVQRELELYSHGLAAKPRIVVANKIDIPGSEDGLAKLVACVPGDRVFPVSGVTGAGLEELARHLAGMLREPSL